MSPLREYIQDLMNDRKSDLLSQGIKLCLLVFSYIYTILIAGHHFFYKVNLLKSYKAPVATLSIGNITLGGTGKTPFTIMLAERLANKNKKPAILIRGYGEDEWIMTQDRLEKTGVKVFVGRDRVKFAGEALQEGADTVILDDGFQHRRLKRDLDIVLIDSTNPFGNGFLFPRGILRESPGSLKRADIIVLTKTDKGRAGVSALEEKIRKIAPGKNIIKARHEPRNLCDMKTGNPTEISSINGKTVCIVSAICDPSYFKYTARETGATVGLEFIFSDHYAYTKNDLNRIFEECKKKEINIIITTEKDAVKLKKIMPAEKSLKETFPDMLVLGIELKIVQGEKELDEKIDRLYMRTSGKSA